ncbi:MAG: PKD domain-containing protein, partial [Flavobacteriales bacterium]|nr:PKD domain-containing protein [Flavobacteriales bacterium]
MSRTLCILLTLLLLLLNTAWKPFDERPTSSGESENTGFQFIENKGQWNNNISFLANVPNGKLYLGKRGFSYVFLHPEDLAKLGGHGRPMPDNGVLRSHIFTIEFIGASGEQNEGARAFSEYHNYYHGSDRARWASRVPLYREVQYPNMYPNIGMSIYGDNYQLKYDFTVNPGGIVGNIQMKYSGLDQLYIREGALHIVTSVNEIVEQRPYAFQIINGKKVEVACNFIVSDDVVTFELPNGYNHGHQLVIDPKLIFSTFSGSLADNWGFTATFDQDGLVYSGGIAFDINYQNLPGDTMFLPTLGAFQDSFAGGTSYACDMGIIKYTASGSGRIYSTYLGGSLNECPHSLVATPNGDVLILGTTASANFPTTIFAFDSTFNGGSPVTSSSSIEYLNGSDIVVAKLSFDGTALISSTYIGGSGNDGLNLDDSTRYNYGDDFRGEIIVDGNGDCYVSSTTASTNFPMVGGFQTTYGGGETDGVTFKLSSNFYNLIWSSYIGGSNSDAAYAVQFDQSNDVYVCGGTTSSNFPTTVGALNPSSNGGVDGFVAHISSDGSTLIGSTYIGTSEYDQTYFVQLDSAENVYVVGQTKGIYSIVPDSILGTIYSNAGGKQFIHKLNNSLTETAFSTVYGSGGTVPDISPSAFLVNNCGNIFVSGWGGATGSQQGSTFGLPTTSNAEQLGTDGSDFHLLVLLKDAVSVLYATFFGGSVSHEHVDGGTSRFDKNGIVYQSVCGGCGGNSDYPTTPGVWSNTNNSSNCNNAVFKFDMSDISARFDVQDQGCVPFTATFQNQSTGGLTFLWDYGDGTTSTLFEETHTYLDTGVYNVSLIVTDSTTCQVKDSAFVTITVTATPIPVITPDTAACQGDTLTLSVSGGAYYVWSASNTLSCLLCPSPQATPDSNTQYTVNVIDLNGCQIMDTVNVAILPSPIAIVGPGDTLCPGTSVTLNSVGGVAYSWFPDSSLINANMPNPTASPVVTTDYVVTVYDL